MDPNAARLRAAFDAAVAASHPGQWLRPALAALAPPRGVTRVVALGKAAVPMAEVFAETWAEAYEGLLIAPAGSGRPVPGFELVEGSHPVPDATSLAAGEAALAFAGRCEAGDRLLILISGGASAVACAPVPGVTLAQKAEVTRALLGSGWQIERMNGVRRLLSRLKGGGLLRAAGEAEVVTLAQSDVPSDDAAIIGSGPGVAAHFDVTVAESDLALLTPEAGGMIAAARRWRETATTPASSGRAEVLCRIDHAARAAGRALADTGLPVRFEGVITGPAEAAARRSADQLMDAGASVSWGETTVARPAGGGGRGGRNQHYLLALAIELAGRGDFWALAADTDGIDGSSDAAGAWIDPTLLRRLDVSEARAALESFDAHGFFERHGRLLRTGPTGVNVGDLRLVLVDPARRA